MRGKRVAVAMCGGELFELMPYAAFAALIPLFIAEWGLSNAEAGWIGGVQALGYMVAVPFLGAATDRIDARLIYIGAGGLSLIAGLGFALSAEGFWSALAWRALAGAGHAGMYMPGLRAITDRVEAAEKSRVVVSYTATYSVGVALSFLAVGALAEWLGWQAAFALTALGPAVAGLNAALALRPKPPPPPADPRPAWRLFGGVLRNRRAMIFILAYGCHTYELTAFRAWAVAFMAYAAAGSPGWTLAPTLVAFLVTLFGLPASILGNEAALRLGRHRLIAGVMALSALVALGLGVSAGGPYLVTLALMLAFAVTIAADSGSITAGTVAAAEPELQGATMALHSMVGFGLGFVGPLAAGLALDGGGGREAALAWFFAFAAMAAGPAIGLVLLAAFRRAPPG